jgi:uncharacterized protein
MSISRRSFLGSSTLAGVATPAFLGAATDAKTGMPTRVFGRTGARISILAFGCGSRFLAYKDPDKACESLNRALDLGVTYVDTAYGYGDGQSEEWVGRVMKTRRNGLWLTTKINKRNGDEAMRVLEGSLKRLNTDRVDLIHVHSLLDDADLAAVEAPNGVLKTLYKLRDQRVTRAIGVSSHMDPVVLRKAIERNDFDCTQMALNAARAGMRNVPSGFAPNYMHDSFESLVLPVARRKKMGVIAMKVFAQEGLSGKATAEKLMHYSMSLPVSAIVVGMPKLEFVDENIAIAKRFKPMPRNEMKRMADDLSAEHKARLDTWFHNHVDC